MTRARISLTITAGAVLLMSACTETPTQPPSHTGPLVAVYMIDFGNPAVAAAHQNLFPYGVRGMSPREAATTFKTPLSGQTPGIGFVPPGIYMLPSGPPLDINVASGPIPTGYTDAFGNTYPDNTFVWVGYFTR